MNWFRLFKWRVHTCYAAGEAFLMPCCNCVSQLCEACHLKWQWLGLQVITHFLSLCRFLWHQAPICGSLLKDNFFQLQCWTYCFVSMKQRMVKQSLAYLPPPLYFLYRLKRKTASINYNNVTPVIRFGLTRITMSYASQFSVYSKCMYGLVIGF